MIRLRNLLIEQDMEERMTALAQRIDKEVKAPFVRAQVATLGGPERASVLVAISFEPKSKWKSGIFENSSYARFHLHADSTMELFTKYPRELPKFRKTKFKSADDAINKLNAYVHEASK